MINFIEWLASTSGSTALRESLYMYPWIESAHVLFIAIFFGTLLFVDLRLTGYGFKSLSISQMNAKILPLTIIGFVLREKKPLGWLRDCLLYTSPSPRDS